MLYFEITVNTLVITVYICQLCSCNSEFTHKQQKLYIIYLFLQFVICDLFEQVTTALNEQAKKLANYDVEVSKLKTEVRMLKDQLTEKERELQAKEKELMDMKKSFPCLLYTSRCV